MKRTQQIDYIGPNAACLVCMTSWGVVECLLASYLKDHMCSLKINENGLATRRPIGPHPEFLSCLSTIVDGCRNHTQKINDRCQVQMFPRH